VHAVADQVDAFEVDRVQVLLGQLDPDAVELFTFGAVRLVRDGRAQQAVADLLAVDFGLEAGLELGNLLAVLASEVAEVALRREAPELADTPVAVDRLADRFRLAERGQVGIALVDRLELERVFVAGVVEVVLLVELGDEAVGALAEAVQISGGGRGGCHSRRRIAGCGRSA
jgi:hypothetical protein